MEAGGIALHYTDPVPRPIPPAAPSPRPAPPDAAAGTCSPGWERSRGRCEIISAGGDRFLGLPGENAMKLWIERLGSLKLTVVLLLVVGVVLAVGTIFESLRGAEAARAVYYAPWFFALEGLFGLNLLAALDHALAAQPLADRLRAHPRARCC